MLQNTKFMFATGIENSYPMITLTDELGKGARFDIYIPL